MLDAATIGQEHLSRFQTYCPRPFPEAEKEGRSPKAWFKLDDLKDQSVVVGELPEKVTRGKLLNMARTPGVSTLELCICIFAWGGMHGANRARLFAQPPGSWLALANEIRAGVITRAEGYGAFVRMRDSDSGLAGMGPAFFTKLLYFLPPGTPEAPKGYIMDQWLGCSINLLTGRQVVKLDHHLTWKKTAAGTLTQDVTSIVSDVNSSEDYEAFCQTIESLSSLLGSPWTPDTAERALIAFGGSKPHPWREYVVGQRRSNLINGMV